MAAITTSGKATTSAPTSVAAAYVDIIESQEQLLTQTDRLMATLLEAADEGKTIDSSQVRAHVELVKNLKSFFLLFQQRAIGDLTDIEKELNESKNRELEWKELADVLSQYRQKVGSELKALKDIVANYNTIKDELQAQLREREAEIISLRQEFIAVQDIFIRIQATHRRKANLRLLQKEIEDEEIQIEKAISSMRINQEEASYKNDPEYQVFQLWLKNQALQKEADS